MSQDANTAPALAGLLDLTAAAVRRHLESLLADGLIAPRVARRRATPGRGRPAVVFEITDAGRALFRQGYGELAAQAISQLVAVAGPDGLAALATAHFAPVREGFASSPRPRAVDALVEAFDRNGYAAEVSRLTTGEQLCLHHCPVVDVAREFPAICEAETQLIAALLDSHVQRLATIAHGDGVCTTSIPAGGRK